MNSIFLFTGVTVCAIGTVFFSNSLIARENKKQANAVVTFTDQKYKEHVASRKVSEVLPTSVLKKETGGTNTSLIFQSSNSIGDTQQNNNKAQEPLSVKNNIYHDEEDEEEDDD
ncbi:MAG: hypothetical protein KBC41_01605 [Candidatus Pacebacteria bacterium]|nr:hypothetical protein [Candidatus Paceibacterota bacterium]